MCKRCCLQGADMVVVVKLFAATDISVDVIYLHTAGSLVARSCLQVVDITVACTYLCCHAVALAALSWLQVSDKVVACLRLATAAHFIRHTSYSMILFLNAATLVACSSLQVADTEVACTYLQVLMSYPCSISCHPCCSVLVAGSRHRGGLHLPGGQDAAICRHHRVLHRRLLHPPHGAHEVPGRTGKGLESRPEGFGPQTVITAAIMSVFCTIASCTPPCDLRRGTRVASLTLSRLHGMSLGCHNLLLPPFGATAASFNFRCESIPLSVGCLSLLPGAFLVAALLCACCCHELHLELPQAADKA